MIRPARTWNIAYEWKIYQCMTPFCKQISAHEPNHRLNGDESPRESAHHVHCRTWCIFEQKLKTWKHNHHPKIPVHSSNNESDTKNLETQHRPSVVKGTRNDFQIQQMYMSGFLLNPRPWKTVIHISFINTLWLNDYIWPHRTGSALARVMAQKKLNQYRLGINGVLWHLPKTNFTGSAQGINS